VRYTTLGCAPGVLEVGRFAASLLQSPLRGSLFVARASRAYCYLNVDVNATYCRRAAARLSLRASRSGCAPLRGAWLALLRSLSLLAASRLAGLGSCSAVALLSLPAPRGAGRRCAAVAALVPASRIVARSRRCCGSPPGSVIPSTSVPGAVLESLSDLESQII
jgi:hypothetical protein